MINEQSPKTRRYTTTMADFDAQHADRICKHYVHAKEKHPYFCDHLLPHDIEPPALPIEEQVEINLALYRERIKCSVKLDNVLWYEILNCELWEAVEAINNRDYDATVGKCYDAIAVLLRTIDVLEGRQKLGR